MVTKRPECVVLHLLCSRINEYKYMKKLILLRPTLKFLPPNSENIAMFSNVLETDQKSNI